MEKRRQFLKRLFGFVVGASVSLTPALSLLKRALAESARIVLPKGTKRETLIDKNPADLDATHLEVTPTENFGTMGLSDHVENMEKWRLQVTGGVENPLRFKYDEILAMPAIERSVLMICPGFFANHGLWKGFFLKDLLEMAEAEKNLTRVTFSSQEGAYGRNQEFSMEEILAGKVFLSYGVNGESLPEKHGFPLRVVAEGHYGSSWIKYVSEVKVG